MKDFLKIFIAILLLSCTQNVFSQGCDDPDEEGDDPDKIKIFGFFQPQYEYHLTDPKPSNTFKFKRARVGLTGNIPYDFSYYAVMENSAFVSATGNPYMLDAFISYKRFKWAKVSVGSFKQPFGMEVNTACSKLYTIERSYASDQFIAPQRDMGVMILGGTNETFAKYAVAIMNGRGLGIKDNNNKKDLVGRLTIKPLEFLRLGGSFRYGFPTADSLERITYAGEIEFKYSGFTLQAEYIADQGDYNRAAGGGCGADPLTLGEDRNGMYVQAMYMTNFNLEPVVKFELFDSDLNSENTEQTLITFGANYFFNDMVRLQANYRYRAEKGAEIPNDDIMLQLQVKF